MPPRRHESACLAAQAAHHHHRGQCQPRSAPASLSFSRHDLSLSLSRSPPAALRAPARSLTTVCDLAEGAGCVGRYACGKNNNLSRRKVFYVFLLETLLNLHSHSEFPTYSICEVTLGKNPRSSVGFEEMLSQVDFALWKGVWFGGEISTEISLKSRPTLAASKRVFFCGSRSQPGRPGAHPPASVRRCRRRRRPRARLP